MRTLDGLDDRDYPERYRVSWTGTLVTLLSARCVGHPPLVSSQSALQLGCHMTETSTAGR